MRDGLRPDLYRLGLLTAGVLTLSACAYSPGPTLVSRTAPPETVAGTEAGPDSSRTVVEVRAYSVSPTVSVIAWEKGEETIGLRTWLARNGDPVAEGSRLTDHRLYISTVAIVEPGGPRRATAFSQELRISGVMRETHPCEAGNCLPVTSYGVAIPDAVLRANRDSFPVKLYTRGDSELVIVVPGDVIHRYLQTVDSVASALRSSSPRLK